MLAFYENRNLFHWIYIFNSHPIRIFSKINFTYSIVCEMVCDPDLWKQSKYQVILLNLNSILHVCFGMKWEIRLRLVLCRMWYSIKRVQRTTDFIESKCYESMDSICALFAYLKDQKVKSTYGKTICEVVCNSDLWKQSKERLILLNWNKFHELDLHFLKTKAKSWLTFRELASFYYGILKRFWVNMTTIWSNQNTISNSKLKLDLRRMSMFWCTVEYAYNK